MWVCLKNGLLNQAQWRPHWDMIWNINNLTLKLGVFETAIFTINAWRLNLKKCWYTHTYVYIYIQTTHLTDKHGDAPESWFPTWAWVWIFSYPTRINYVLPCLSASAKSLNTFNPPVPLRNFIAVEFLDEKNLQILDGLWPTVIHFQVPKLVPSSHFTRFHPAQVAGSLGWGFLGWQDGPNQSKSILPCWKNKKSWSSWHLQYLTFDFDHC